MRFGMVESIATGQRRRIVRSVLAMPLRSFEKSSRGDLISSLTADVDQSARGALCSTLAYAHEFVEALPQGYDTVLDERGSNLSGGQRQRLCLARAFLKDAPVLFLDEPTSSVDAESERLIGDAVERLSMGRTVVTIAHTAEIMDGADLRVVLDGGRAVAS